MQTKVPCTINLNTYLLLPLLFLLLQSLPNRGVRIFSGLPHTHNLGTSVRIRHIRSGVERPVPFQDRFYDPNYQTMRHIDFDLKPVSDYTFELFNVHLHLPSKCFSKIESIRKSRFNAIPC